MRFLASLILLPLLAWPLAFSTVPAHAAATDETPVALELDAAKIEQRGVTATVEKGVLKIHSGHAQEWPGVTLKAPNGRWDWGAREYFAVDLKNTGATKATVTVRVDNAGADGAANCNNGHLDLAPGESGTLRVTFSRAALGNFKGKLFGMRGVPKGTGGATGATIDPAQVTDFLVFVPHPTEDQTFEASNFRVGGSYTPPALPQDFFPLIDTFGQYIHKEWPGKTHSVEELKQRAAAEPQDWTAHPGPANWDKWGGWANGPQLEATGFFRTAKQATPAGASKWWLVDPDGHLFWSSGVTGVRPGGSTPIDERATWFAEFPGDKPEFKEFFETATNVVHGYYQGKAPVECFNFENANLKRKYGGDWRAKLAGIFNTRLRSWGLNTIANWSDPAICMQHKTAYTGTISFSSKAIQGSTGYWGQFKDPFDASFRDNLRAAIATQKDKAVGDPWCLGFFVDNELSWGNDTSLAAAALQSPPTQAAKVAFLDDLKAKYGTIEKLNAAWGTTHTSWEALAEFRAAPDAKNPAVSGDLKAFYSRLAEQYFKTIHDELKAASPHQLYLGCRFAGTNDSAATAATKFCDVVSYNRYQRSVRDLKPAGGADVPLIIGEFHFGALDRGMFHTGLVPTKSQDERAESYKAYLRGALENPYLVGTHWFQFWDEPTTGRPLDEENYQIGLIDGCDTPYPETIAATREIGAALYATRAGK